MERGDYFLDPLQSSQVTYEPRFIPPNKSDKLFTSFLKLDFNKAHLTRSVIWFGPRDYQYGLYTTLPKRPLESNVDILNLSEKLSLYLDASFNSCLVNLYNDQTQMVPPHSDDEPIFGMNPVIASLSFGATRRFVFEPKPPVHSLKGYNMKSIKSRYVFELGDGDLIVMRGPTQRFWNHSVPRENFPCGPRINLTFRNVVS